MRYTQNPLFPEITGLPLPEAIKVVNDYYRPENFPRVGIDSPDLKRDLLKLQSHFPNITILRSSAAKCLLRIGEMTPDSVVGKDFVVLWINREPDALGMNAGQFTPNIFAIIGISDHDGMVSPKNLIDGKRWPRSAATKQILFKAFFTLSGFSTWTKRHCPNIVGRSLSNPNFN